MTTHLGYIVQVQDEEDFTPYHGAMKLYRSFDDALAYAEELYRGYLEIHSEEYEGPFEVSRATKYQCDVAGSVLVFRSLNCYIWIDHIVE